MAIAEKYEWLNDANAPAARAVHRRLGREVTVTSIPIRDLDEKQRTAICEIASKLARLEHPALPFLVDFVQDESFYHLIFESFQQPFDWSAISAFDQIRVLDQICDALVHAGQRGIQHGRLDRSSLRADPEGQLKLVGMGMQQLDAVAATPDATALPSHSADIEQTLSWLRDSVADAPNNAEEASHKTDDRMAELRSIVNQAERGGYATIEALHADLHRWTERETIRSQSEKLRFEDVTSDGEPPSQPLKSRWLALAVAGLACLALVCLLVSAFWPRDAGVSNQDTRPSDARSVDPAGQTAVMGVAGDAESDNGEQAPSSTLKPLVSDLANVGVLNNAVPSTDSNASDAESGPDKAPDSDRSTEVDSKKSDTDMETSNVPAVPARPPRKPASSSSQPDRPQPIKNPFAGIAKAVSLPDVEQTQAVLLAETRLPASETIEIRLIGGLGAHASAEFQLVPKNKRQWEVAVAESTVGRLVFNNGKLRLRWQTDKETSDIAPYFANTALVLKYGESQHVLALRKYQRLPAIPVNIERRKPYDLDVRHPPEPNDVMLELVPASDSLAVALPKGIIGITERMRIGLDAGKKSLFVLQVEPKFGRRNQSLATRASVRMNPNQTRFSAVKPGMEARLRIESRTAARNLFQLKAARKQADNDVKKRLDRQIKILEENKKRMESFAESYLLAAQSKLQFRIYRQVGRHRIPLIALED